MGIRLAVRSPQSIWASFPTGWNVVSAGGGDIGGDFQTLSRDFYEKNPLVYACINEIATSTAEPRMQVERFTGGDWEAQGDGHPLAQLLEYPNPYMTAYDFWYVVTMYRAIGGNAFVEIERSGNGRPIGLWPIRPDRVEIIPGPTGSTQRIVGYKIKISADLTIPLPPDAMMHFKTQHPRSDLWGLSPLSVCLTYAGIDNSAGNFVKAFFDNAGVPYGILTSKNRLADPMVEFIKDRWKSQFHGPEGWHEIAVIDSDVAFQKIGISATEIDMSAVHAIPETRICQVFQVPPILVGAMAGLQNATYANYQEARKSFWQDTLSPIYKSLIDQVNMRVAPEFGQGIRAQWDFSQVVALNEDADLLHNRVRADVTAGFVLVNEARQKIGLPSVAGGDVFLRPLLMQEIPAVVETKAMPISIEDRLLAETKPVAELPAAVEDVKNLIWWKAIDRTARKFEEPVKAAAAKQFGVESDGLLALLRREGKNSKAGVPFQTFLFSALDYLLMDSAPAWRSAFLPIFEAIFQTQADNIAARFGISFNLDSTETLQFLEQYTMRFSESLFQVNERAINQLVVQAQGEGWSVPTLRDAIQSTWGDFAESRAEMIARSETIRSSNAGAHEAFRQAGISRIQWLTARDGRVCEWCDPLNGKTVGIEEHFFTDGEEYSVADGEGKPHSMKLDYGNVDYPPLHPNCRCTVIVEQEKG